MKTGFDLREFGEGKTGYSDQKYSIWACNINRIAYKNAGITYGSFMMKNPQLLIHPSYIMVMHRILGIIPARGGSKGILRKNIHPLAGKPLIAWTIEAALNSKVCERVLVSTDSHDIKKIAQDWGAEVPFIRPKHLASDTATSIAVIQHAIEYLLNEGVKKSDYILLLQPTSPLRNEEDIQNVIDIGKSKHAVAVISVTEPLYHPCKTHMITPQGVLQRFFKNNSADNMLRQNLPQAYAENGAIYLNRIFSLIEEQTFIPENKTHPYIMPPERSIDIDTPWDLYLAELILKEQKIKEQKIVYD